MPYNFVMDIPILDAQFMENQKTWKTTQKGDFAWMTH